MDQIGTSARKAGRKPSEVVLVAVTKSASIDQIQDLVSLGHMDLAENRVQQLIPRVESISRFVEHHNQTNPARKLATRWHMIGTLQRNKVKQVVPAVQLIHSVDTLRLAEEISEFAIQADKTVDILLQVNVSNEVSKHGIAASAAIHMVEQLYSMMHLRVRGLMTMAPYSENPEDARPVFARLREIYEEIRGKQYGGETFNLLSMGMSGDYQVAIEEGANLVRVGRALFGESQEEPQA
jgi:pyridoxal phosphate enzyme (YggS family)